MQRRDLASAGRALGIILLALAVFGAWMHWAVLDPHNIGWLLDGNDRGANALGTAAYLRAETWPWLRQPLLGYPEGLALLFTDSVPLVGLLAKPFAPAGIQLVGIWYLLSVILQAGFAFALVRRHAVDPLAAWLGAALLTFVPVLLNRYGHPSLCAQWLILWALWVHVEPRRARSGWWWLAVLATAAMVHAYLLLMVASVWAGTLLRRVVVERSWAVPAQMVAVLVPIGTIVALHGVTGGGFVSSGGYGRWPMALDAWWNPGNPSYAALIPSSPDDGTGRGFEGLQYLGAGMLALVPVAIVVAWRRAQVRAGWRRLAWLLPGFAVLLMLAIGPAPVWRGAALFRVELPAGVRDALDPVRAAGRLAWPLTYLLMLAAVTAVARMPRAALVLAGALALQVADLAEMAAAIRATSARAEDRTTYVRTLDPRWDRYIASAGSIDIEPPAPFGDLALLEEVAWRAVAACRPLRYFYAARDTAAARARLRADAAAFRRGVIDPRRFYVIVSGKVPARVRERVVMLDGVAVVPPTATARLPRCATPSSPRSAS